MKIYSENIAKYDASFLTLSKALKRLSTLRLFIFICTLVLSIYLVSSKIFTPLLIVLPIAVVAFGFVMNRYIKTAYLRKHTLFLKKINELELLRNNCELEEFDTGNRFLDPNHPFTSDLDIFGQHSVFQLVNRTTTESGMILLAEWLSGPANNNVLLHRQKAIKELSLNLEWRQDFQASGMHFQNRKSDYYKLLDWVKAPIVLLRNIALYKTITIIIPILILISAYFFYANLDSLQAGLFLVVMISILIVNFIILRKVGHLADHIVETSTHNLNTLRGYRTLIRKIENGSFNSEKLKKLQSVLKNGKHSAYNEISSLCKTLEYSQQRSRKGESIGGSAFYALFNQFLLLDIHLIIDTEKWKLKNRDSLKTWAEVVSEFEVINSLAGFCYSNPSYIFPEITERKNFVHFELLGHPLINTTNRICNDFYSEGQGDIVMITGSNMAGKSTFLRTVGVNIVLALSGAPCCASKGQLSNFQLFSSMRTEDNLKKGISSFYAELSRIEKMLKLIERNDNVFFLLDEMFKGTNSEDRHRGGFSFINQISKLKTSGIIATHDIELAKLAGNEQLVTNFSFNSEIQNDEMFFSYHLDSGICVDFNASELMKRSGIQIIPIK